MLKIGLCQMLVSEDKQANLRKAGEMIREAAAQGANFVMLPEMFNCPYVSSCFPVYAEPAGGETWQFLSSMAKECGVYLIGGSIPEEENGHIYNTSFIFSPEGRQIGRHRKVHLFDIDVPGGQRFMESDTLTAGDDMTLIDTEYGKIGVAICFDIRFTEFFRAMTLAGVQAIFVPAAFNMTTGPAHWEFNFRIRAMDCQCWIAGCSPARDVNGPYVAYGHSLLCDPWGAEAAMLGIDEEVRVVEFDLAQNERIRAQMPILAARRTDLYDTVWKKEQ